MGWWTVERAGATLVVGDDPYDTMMQAFADIAEQYRHAHGRGPTIAELVQTVETVLATGAGEYCSDGSTVDVDRLSANVKKRPRVVKANVGDFFTVPLDRSRYAFGRVLADDEREDIGLLLGIYDLAGTTVPELRQLKTLGWMFPPFFGSEEGLKTGRWKVIGNLPMDDNEFEYPKFKEGMEGMGWWIRDRHGTSKSTPEQIENLDYLKLWSLGDVEDRLRAYLRTAQ